MVAGRLVSNGVALTPDSILNPGQRLVHRIPATTEPDAVVARATARWLVGPREEEPSDEEGSAGRA